ESSWMLTGRANYILDNLIAEGKARPMIIVNPLGYARQAVGVGPERPQDVAAPGGRGAAPGGPPGGLFGQDLLEDVVPFVERTFRLTEGRHEWVVWRHHLNEVAPLLFR